MNSTPPCATFFYGNQIPLLSLTSYCFQRRAQHIWADRYRYSDCNSVHILLFGNPSHICDITSSSHQKTRNYIKSCFNNYVFIPLLLFQTKLQKNIVWRNMRRIVDEIVDSIKSPERPRSPIDTYLTEREIFQRQNPQVRTCRSRSSSLSATARISCKI